MLTRKNLYFLVCLIYFFKTSTYPMDDTSRGELLPSSSIPLSLALTSTTIPPGIYESDDIGRILSYPLAHFGSEDIVVFDCDEVLHTGLNPFHIAHHERKIALSEKLYSQSLTLRDKFHLYIFLTTTYFLIDKRTPLLIKSLQLSGIKCIANTGLNPTILPTLGIDCPSLRVQTLRNLGFNFTTTFPEFSSWNFDTLLRDAAVEKKPVFKDGVIFSTIPKPITLLELFKKLNFKPRRVVFVDDSIQNVKEMFQSLSECGIECWSYHYSKRESLDLQSCFSKAFFDGHLAQLEIFLERLLEGGDIDVFLRDAPKVQLLKIDES